jgi:hypothetical protein
MWYPTMLPAAEEIWNWFGGWGSCGQSEGEDDSINKHLRRTSADLWWCQEKTESKWKDPEVNLILVHTPGNHES